MKKRLLFIGGDQPLSRQLLDYSSNDDRSWSVEIARSADEAMAILERINPDAVVADLKLPDANGVTLLDTIMQRQPKALRIVLSDFGDPGATMQCVGKAHQHLLKPCDVLSLFSALARGLALEAWLPSEAVQGLIGRMKWVPSPPAIYSQVVSELQSPHASTERIGELVSQDPAIAAKVLQLANSAVFGLQLQVIEPAEAVAYIGLEATKALVLLAHTFASFDKLHLAGFSAESLWDHSVFTGQIARRIASSENSPTDLTEQAFAAGLLHDIGKLLFAANLPEPFGRVFALAREQQRELWEAETQIFGASHAELGASILGIWGLPNPIVEAVAQHHCPSRSANETFSPLTAVHVANAFEHETRQEDSGIPQSGLDFDYLQSLALDHRIEEWHRLCLAVSGDETA